VSRAETVVLTETYLPITCLTYLFSHRQQDFASLPMNSWSYLSYYKANVTFACDPKTLSIQTYCHYAKKIADALEVLAIVLLK
jgi:hypothetical protein